MSHANQNQNNPVPVHPKPPPGGGDGLKVQGPIAPTFVGTDQPLAGVSATFKGVTYNFCSGPEYDPNAYFITYFTGRNTTLNLVNTPAKAPLILSGTQPRAIVFNGLLCLFWLGSGRNGVWYTASSDGSSWSAQAATFVDQAPSAKGEANLKVQASDDNTLLYVSFKGENGELTGAVMEPA